MKRIVAGIFGLALMTTAASAVQVYERVFGDWLLHGHQQGEEMSCVASTSFEDGTRINVNIFPKRDGSQNATMTITNPRWYFDQPVDTFINTTVAFVGTKVGFVELNAPFQVYSTNKIIVRDLNENFGNYFRDAKYMIMFPKTKDELYVSLRGTTAMGYGLADCSEIVKSSNY